MKTLTQSISVVLLGISLAISLAACNSAADPTTSHDVANSVQSSPARSPAPRRAAVPPKCYDCGTITSIEQMKSKGEGSGLGAVLGAVAGAVVGHQVGDGRGKDAATVAGAVGGGFAGNEIEKRVKGTTYYHVTVAMEDGGTRTADVDALNGLSTGSRVKIIGNSLQTAGR